MTRCAQCVFHLFSQKNVVVVVIVVAFFLRFTAAHLRNASHSRHVPPLRYSLGSSWGRALKKLGEKYVPLKVHLAQK